MNFETARDNISKNAVVTRLDKLVDVRNKKNVTARKLSLDV